LARSNQRDAAIASLQTQGGYGEAEATKVVEMWYTYNTPHPSTEQVHKLMSNTGQVVNVVERVDGTFGVDMVTSTHCENVSELLETLKKLGAVR
jgi:hypothetical protein